MKQIRHKTIKFSEGLPDVTRFLNIIAEENRLKILSFLQGGEQCVCDIWKYLGIPQNLTSHHLKVLKDAQLLSSRKEGVKVFYSLRNNVLKKNAKALVRIVPFHDM